MWLSAPAASLLSLTEAQQVSVQALAPDVRLLLALTLLSVAESHL